MPMLDQTGPEGQGPLTGRGRGVSLGARGQTFSACIQARMSSGMTQAAASKVCGYQRASERAPQRGGDRGNATSGW